MTILAPPDYCQQPTASDPGPGYQLTGVSRVGRLLLDRAVDLILEMADVLGKKGDLMDVAGLIDLFDKRGQSSELVALIDKRLQQRQTSLDSLPLVFMENSASPVHSSVKALSLAEVRMMPDIEQDLEILTYSMLINLGARFPARFLFETRRGAINRLAERAWCDLGLRPGEASDLVEATAKKLLDSFASIEAWNRFYQALS